MKIAIANDTPLAVEALRRTIEANSPHAICWIARDGQQAIDLCALQRPDVLLMDLVMPVVDGVEATRQIMSKGGCAILIVTADVGANAARVYEAMNAGALGAIDVPVLNGFGAQKSGAMLMAKISEIAASRPAELDRARADSTGRAPTSRGADTLVAIGASAGGPAALATILAGLPRAFDAATVIVQHVDAAFASGMAEWLNQQSSLPVRTAREGDRPQPGMVLLAATDDHLWLTSRSTFGYTKKPEHTPYRPSIDVFFQSIVELWTGRAVGLLLTGMGRDGAVGLKAMRARGFSTIAQDRETSAVYGMPKAAAEIGAAGVILPLPKIADALVAAIARD